MGRRDPLEALDGIAVKLDDTNGPSPRPRAPLPPLFLFTLGPACERSNRGDSATPTAIVP